MKKVLVLFSFFILFLVIIPVLNTSFAAGPFDNCTVSLRAANGDTVDVPKLSCIFPLISDSISWLLEFSGIVAVLVIIYAGIRYTFSGGDEKQIEGARKIIVWAILGLVLIFMSFAIVRFISQVTGVSCIDPKRPMSFTSCS